MFDNVVVVTAVLRELTNDRTPPAVRQWVSAPPAWLKIADPMSCLSSTASLDAGEADAISLAKERKISDVLMDEFAGRKVAIAEGLFPLPTLAILERAAERRLLELRPVLEALLRTSYRIQPEMMEAALARDALRPRSTEG